ncbi:hypothetical protein [Sinorhizobium saheli]|uniref:hypothetical protein n=1 Tax=Sinorhizobium saheli TaxID=36856 RepID=UPI001AEF1C88
MSLSPIATVATSSRGGTPHFPLAQWNTPSPTPVGSAYFGAADKLNRHVLDFNRKPSGASALRRFRPTEIWKRAVEWEPIRFMSTLGPGERLTISVPQALGQSSRDFEIVRDGDVLMKRPAP